MSLSLLRHALAIVCASFLVATFQPQVYVVPVVFTVTFNVYVIFLSSLSFYLYYSTFLTIVKYYCSSFCAKYSDPLSSVALSFLAMPSAASLLICLYDVSKKLPSSVNSTTVYVILCTSLSFYLYNSIDIYSVKRFDKLFFSQSLAFAFSIGKFICLHVQFMLACFYFHACIFDKYGSLACKHTQASRRLGWYAIAVCAKAGGTKRMRLRQRRTI